MIPQRKQRNSTRVNLIVSLAFHSIIVIALFLFAAREGMLGKQLKKIAVTMVPKEKPPEKPKEKQPEPKIEPPNVDTPKDVEKPQMAQQPRPVAAPPAASFSSIAPPPAVVPSFDFSGGRIVETSSNPGLIYKGFVEYMLRSKWDRPEDVQDEDYVAELELAIDSTGKIIGVDWKKGSGNSRWDESIRRAVAQTKSMNRPPPKDFPEKFVVRFDVQPVTEPILQ